MSNIHNASLAAKIILLSALTAGAFATAAAFGAMAGTAALATANMASLTAQTEKFQGIAIGGATVPLRSSLTFESAIVIERDMDVETAIDEHARRLKDEWRRRSPG